MCTHATLSYQKAISYHMGRTGLADVPHLTEMTFSFSWREFFLAVDSTLKERNFPFAVGLITTFGDGETCCHNTWYFLLCAERTMGAQKS